jgi:hypothetical protein
MFYTVLPGASAELSASCRWTRQGLPPSPGMYVCMCEHGCMYVCMCEYGRMYGCMCVYVCAQAVSQVCVCVCLERRERERESVCVCIMLLLLSSYHIAKTLFTLTGMHGSTKRRRTSRQGRQIRPARTQYRICWLPPGRCPSHSIGFFFQRNIFVVNIFFSLLSYSFWERVGCLLVLLESM